eukprot:3537370-Rhodomonas_salina.3
MARRHALRTTKDRAESWQHHRRLSMPEPPSGYGFRRCAPTCDKSITILGPSSPCGPVLTEVKLLWAEG